MNNIYNILNIKKINKTSKKGISVVKIDTKYYFLEKEI